MQCTASRINLGTSLGGKQRLAGGFPPSFAVASAVDESEFQGPELRMYGNQAAVLALSSSLSLNFKVEK